MNMKVQLLLIMIIAPLYSMAQTEYEPFIVEGKVWYYEHTDWREKYIYKVYFEGDTVIDGHGCKKMLEERPGRPIYSPCSCREEEGKVWVYYTRYSNQPCQEWLLYDFTCQEGDTVTNLLLYGAENFHVDEVKVIPSFGRDRRRIAMKQDGDGPKSYSGYWLEGVGSRLDMFNIWAIPHAGASERFLYCELDGERIADQNSFGDAALETSGLNEKFKKKECTSSPIHDIHGRRVSGTSRPGIYIRNGKKVVNSRRVDK